MGKIYLIRHGQTAANSEKKLQGRMDTPLNAAGLEQAGKLAAWFSAIPLDALYCSTLRRARMTAAPLAAACSLPVHCLAELQEASFGLWEGLSYAEINGRWAEQMRLFLTRPGDCVPPQGETFLDVQRRAGAALQAILQAQGDAANIAIVSHGGVIRVLICLLLEIPLNNLWKISVANASVSIFSNWQGNFIAESINCHHYL